MKRVLKTLGIAGIALLGLAINSQADVQQSITITLTVYNQTEAGIRTVKISNRDIIANLVGTNVPGGKLWLVMPDAPSPDSNGSIGAALRVTDARGNVMIDTTSDSFNVYVNFQSQAGTRTYAWNQFSFLFGGLGAEVYGTAPWTKSAGGGGLGAFHCTVSGHCGLGGVTNGDMPCTGTISGSAPRPAT